jgi:hypothetical protein
MVDKAVKKRENYRSLKNPGAQHTHYFDENNALFLAQFEGVTRENFLFLKI